jgi:DNA (cytosine-5)-methyltransferase 1
MKEAYYNEIDPYCAAWLRNLIAAGHIAAGDVDERSIVDVSPDDLRGYDQCHFFAGIGGWSLALRLAGWVDDRPVWTGSCPCQPFSAAGKGTGGKDERHLWPHWFRLIRECRPPVLFGENVEAAIGWGWLDAVLGDLEAEGYATGAAVLGAHSVGAPHIRQRLWFVANAHGRGRNGAGLHLPERGSQQAISDAAGASPTRLLADADGADGEREGAQRRVRGGPPIERARGAWHDLVWLPCSDGKARPTQSTIQCMADGLSDSLGYVRTGEGYILSPLVVGGKNRVGRLRAYGNSVVPQVAAAFIDAAMEAIDVLPVQAKNETAGTKS